VAKELHVLYDARPMGTKALQRLGTKLGARAPLNDSEQTLYETFVRDAKDRVVAVQQALVALLGTMTNALPRLEDADVVGRVKTLSTLSDKLERTPDEKLPSIHDVAGVRIVAQMSTVEQYAVAEALQEAFDDNFAVSRPSLLVDRLAHPKHGYRAIHVVIWPNGRPVEIQIRTELQHAWAQVMEVLGDRWGREMRYGLPIRARDESEFVRRTEFVEGLQSLSLALSEHEQQADLVSFVHMNVEDRYFLAAGIEEDRLAELRTRAEALKPQFAQREAEFHTLLQTLGENFPQ